jgi:hypothetical protein
MNSKASFMTSVLIVIASAFCFAAQAQQRPPLDEKAEETKTGSISGRVVGESGQPLPYAAVYVRSYGSGVQNRATTTDGEGSFQISGLDPFAYSVFAYLPTYTPALRDPDSTQAPYFRVGDSVKIELIRGAVITGTVTSSTGEPLVAVRVRVFMIRDSNGQAARCETPVNERSTDDRGIYRIYGLPPGTYVVSAGGGVGYSPFNLSAYDADIPTYAPASTRDTAAEVNVRAGEEVTNVDIRYRGEPGHVVSGNASGGAVPTGFTIRLTSISKGAAQTTISAYQPPGGRGFSISGVPDGDYDVTAQSSSLSGDGAVSDHQRIKVKGADVTGVVLFTKPLGTISGRIVLEESKVPDCKGKRRPLFTETPVTPWHNEKIVAKDESPFFWGIGGATLPDKQGDFTLRNLAPGQYRFVTRSLAKYWFVQSIFLNPAVAPAAKAAAANRPVDAGRHWVTLKSGDRLATLVVTFAEGAASFHGQIKLAEGQKLGPKVFTYLVPAEREKAEDSLRYFAVRVAADGTFALNNLPPGRYWATTKPAIENESNIVSKLRLPDETEARTKLRSEAETTKIEIEFKPCQNVADYELKMNPNPTAKPGP